MITGDEKWVTYDNPRNSSQWLSPGTKPDLIPHSGLHPKKQLLCVFWDNRGIVHYEILPYEETVNSSLYYDQLERLKEELIKKRPEVINRGKVILQHDNARPHTSGMTREKIRALEWETLLHPPYSPDLVQSDYHLFRSMKPFHAGKKFESSEALEYGVSEFFSSKSSSFYHRRIYNLPERWEKVIVSGGNYFD